VTTPSATPEIVDVLVIGAGPSGAVVTHTAAAAGLSVICLEQGDWVNPSDFPANFPEWELLIQHDWAHDPNVRGLPSDYPVDVSDSDMWPVMFNAVGGSSIYYGAEWPRLLPSDFRVKTLDGVCDDWPISYDDLKPYHDEVDEFIGVSGLGGDTAYPDGLDYPLPPHPLGKPGMKAAAAANGLGWHWWPGTNAIPSQKNKTLEQCARWGVCEWGCPQGAKASFDLIYLPQAQQLGARVYTGARVRRVVTDDAGLATGAEYIDRDGQVVFQPAR
jgi:choline dehydrogenase-like flavoprotein